MMKRIMTMYTRVDDDKNIDDVCTPGWMMMRESVASNLNFSGSTVSFSSLSSIIIIIIIIVIQLCRILFFCF